LILAAGFFDINGSTPCLSLITVSSISICKEGKVVATSSKITPGEGSTVTAKIGITALVFPFRDQKIIGYKTQPFQIRGSLSQSRRRQQAHCQDFAARWAKSHKGDHFLKIQYGMYAATGGKTSNWGGAPLLPPAGDDPGRQ